MSAAIATWIDGRPGDSVPADDRGLQYGDGLFETVLVRGGRPRFLEAHLARLAAGCSRLGISLDVAAELRADIAAACALAPDLAVLKIVVTRGSAVRRGYAPDGGECARRMLSLFASAPLRDALPGVDLEWSRVCVARNAALAGLKHLNRLENVLAARQAREAGVFDVLMMDEGGRVICGSMTNLFLVRGGVLQTPLLDLAGVAGVLRGVVLRECLPLGLQASERALGREDVAAADEVFITNARIGVVPVRRVGEHHFDAGAVTLRLARHVEALDA